MDGVGEWLHYVGLNGMQLLIHALTSNQFHKPALS